jgi:hypothetical protein
VADKLGCYLPTAHQSCIPTRRPYTAQSLDAMQRSYMLRSGESFTDFFYDAGLRGRNTVGCHPREATAGGRSPDRPA